MELCPYYLQLCLVQLRVKIVLFIEKKQAKNQDIEILTKLCMFVLEVLSSCIMVTCHVCFRSSVSMYYCDWSCMF